MYCMNGKKKSVIGGSLASHTHRSRAMGVACEIISEVPLSILMLSMFFYFSITQCRLNIQS